MHPFPSPTILKTYRVHAKETLTAIAVQPLGVKERFHSIDSFLLALVVAIYRFHNSSRHNEYMSYDNATADSSHARALCVPGSHEVLRSFKINE